MNGDKAPSNHFNATNKNAKIFIQLNITWFTHFIQERDFICLHYQYFASTEKTEVQL